MKERLGDLDLSKNKIERLEWIFNFFFIYIIRYHDKEGKLSCKILFRKGKIYEI